MRRIFPIVSLATDARTVLSLDGIRRATSEQRGFERGKRGAILGPMGGSFARDHSFERQDTEGDAFDLAPHGARVLRVERVESVAVRTTSRRPRPCPPNAGGCTPNPGIQNPPASVAASATRGSSTRSSQMSRSWVLSPGLDVLPRLLAVALIDPAPSSDC